jgi:hypothetical protein
MRPVNVFVAPRGNAFMADIAGWIAEAATLTGREARVVQHGLPVADGSLNLVLAPHEFFVLSEASDGEIARAAAACVPICTEQPGTPWFNLAAEFVRDAPAALDINQHGVTALNAQGVAARHLRLGGVPSMVAPAVDRDIEVLFLGGSTPRRRTELAALGPHLWNRAAELRLFRFSRPIDGAVPGTVFGREKYGLLARSRLLLNIHRDDSRPGYFEWARMIEAMANGCAVLTEPSAGFEPLVEGHHFVATDDLAAGLQVLLDDDARCAELGEAARSAVTGELSLAGSLGPLLDELDDTRFAAPTTRRSRRSVPRGHKPPLLPEFRPIDGYRREVYLALLEEQRFLRGVERARCQVVHGDDDVVVRTETSTYAGVQPEVSVIVTLYNYAHLVRDTLDSIASSTDVAYDLVVVDDHSRDDGRAVVQEFMDEHPQVPVRLLGSEVNRGLPASRNLAIAEARAGLLMVVDADNLLYPNCLRVLADALHADQGAAFAYATLEAFGSDTGLRSELAWFPPWLCEANYIDAQALVRRSTYDQYGGYREADDFAYGWEDWELWLRLAEAGERGVHVPRMLGRYRTQASSMITITNLVAAEMVAHMRSLHPGLPWPGPS